MRNNDAFNISNRFLKELGEIQLFATDIPIVDGQHF